jgi:hypothetical protein
MKSKKLTRARRCTGIDHKGYAQLLVTHHRDKLDAILQKYDRETSYTDLQLAVIVEKILRHVWSRQIRLLKRKIEIQHGSLFDMRLNAAFLLKELVMYGAIQSL